MGVETIIAIIAIILLINYIISYIFKTKYLAGYNKATNTTTIDAASLNDNTSISNPVNYSMSLWMYVNDWTYRYGEEKIIAARGFPINNTILLPSPSLTLGSIENQMIIRSSYYLPDGPPPSSATGANTTSNSPITPVMCGVGCNPIDESDQKLLQTLGINMNNLGQSENVISNIPLQKWINVIVSVYGRSMDVYLDGKMVNTFVMPGISAVNKQAGLSITPFGGFSGYTTRMLYLPNSVNPQQAWNIFSDGYGSTPGLVNTKVSVSFSENGVSNGTLTF